MISSHKARYIGSLSMVIMTLLLLSLPQNGHAVIPDMRGTWGGSGGGYEFENVLNDNSEPIYQSKSGVLLVITVQNGRAFAGRSADGTAKITGVILSDNTVTINWYGENNRNIYIGKFSLINGVKVIKGSVNSWEEITLATIPSISTSVFNLKKLKK